MRESDSAGSRRHVCMKRRFEGGMVLRMRRALLFVGVIVLTNNACTSAIEKRLQADEPVSSFDDELIWFDYEDVSHIGNHLMKIRRWSTDAASIDMFITTTDNPKCIAANSAIALWCGIYGIRRNDSKTFSPLEHQLKIEWHKEEQQLPNVYYDGANFVFLTHVGRKDVGNYTCETSWGGWNFSNTINLNVIENANEMTANKTRVRVTVNDSVTLSCHVRGNSPSIFTWHYRKVGNFENSTGPPNTTTVDETDDTVTLQLTNVTRDMKGIYRCSVRDCSHLISDIIDLKVVDVPNLAIDHVKAVGASRVYMNWTLDDGDDPVENLTVICIDHGTKLPRNVNVTISSISPNYIVIDDLENGTSYKFEVIITNSVGDSNPAFSDWVTTFDKDPDFIPNFEIEGATFDTIEVRADAPPLKPQDYVYYYVINVTLEDGKSERHEWNDTESSYFIKNLTSATGYRVQVAACNAYIRSECGNWSDETIVHTEQGCQFIPNVTVKSTTLDSIMMSWSEPPAVRLYQISGYKVQAICEDDTNMYNESIQFNRNTNSYVFANLKSNKTYSLKVAACVYRRTECDDWSRSETAITIDRDPRFVPTVSINKTTPDSILIAWTAPPPELQDRVHQYKVMVLHQNTTIGTFYLPKDNQSYHFVDLESNTTFQVKVAACSDYKTQCGNWSTPQNATTMEQVELVLEPRSQISPMSSTSAVLWSSLAVAILLVIVMGVCMGRQKYRERAVRREFFEATLQRFNLGALNSMNSELDVSDQAELLPYNKEWEFPRELLVLDKILGSGEFGVVRKAEARSICRREKYTIVAVKLVRATARLHCMTALTRELKILANLGKHLNVVNLLGACTKNVPYGELFVIVEFCRFGNLHDYLFSHRANFVDKFGTSVDRSCTAGSSRSCMDGLSSSDSGVGEVSQDADSLIDDQDQSQEPTDTEVESNDCPHTADLVESGLQSKYQGDYADEDLKPVCTQDLLCWAWQVTRGMKYLGSKKILHGDLAARNVLLADHNVVKICDFGMARSLYMDENYWKKGHEPLPVKWMAIESLRDRVFSVQSDIWSFGILLWEFFTLAQTPYPGLNDPETLYQKLVDGFRMAKPKYATEHIHRMMLKCWDVEPLKRPSFDELAVNIAELLDEDVKMHYMELSLPLEEENARAVKLGARDYLTMTPAELQSSIMVTITESRV